MDYAVFKHVTSIAIKSHLFVIDTETSYVIVFFGL